MINLVLSNIPESHIQDRQRQQLFVTQHAEHFHREAMIQLYECFNQFNLQFFGALLAVPYLCLANPSSAKHFGKYQPVSGFGGKGEIILRLSLLMGTHPDVKAGEEYAEGRWLLIQDVLLAMMVHQFQHEIANQPETSYKGHGPRFRDKCNEIGEKLDLFPVRTAKHRGADQHLASCAGWPWNVRPEGYYLGAYPLYPQEAENIQTPGIESLLRTGFEALEILLTEDSLVCIQALSSDVEALVPQLKRIEERLGQFNLEQRLHQLRLELAQNRHACPECGQALIQLMESCLVCGWGIRGYSRFRF
ncbi:MAG: hypothetical protein HC878_15330 [Leptolyngbyaceae cyanobacterium SL_5_14]|nr:hypothetical protein [Leptolyngbyaceae cyanobacterium SL_5_14]